MVRMEGREGRGRLEAPGQPGAADMTSAVPFVFSQGYT
jgi:hypothetical protein